MIPHNKPHITPSDHHAVNEVLASGWLARGPKTETLETFFANYMGGGQAVAVSSGTAALYLALISLGLGKGDNIAVPTYACSALLNAVHMAGCKAILIDCTPDDFTICAEHLGQQKDKPDAIIAVHTYGTPAQIKALRSFNIPILEDCCQALGSTTNHKPLGVHGAASVFSFYATKIVTGGYGGLVWFPETAAAHKAKDYIDFDCRETYIPRFNFHIGDMQSALVLNQLNRLEAIKERRQNIMRQYNEVLPSCFSKPIIPIDQGALPYRYVIKAQSPKEIEHFKNYLEQHHIKSIIPLEPYELLHRYLDLPQQDFPNAETLAHTTLSLPLYPALRDEEIQQICYALRNYDPL